VERRFDLEDRTFRFAKQVRQLVKELPHNMGNAEDGRQLIRSSGSVGANYIEANEAVSKKDFIFRIKLCRKEAKESCYWLRLLDLEGAGHLEGKRESLSKEAQELMNIFGAIIRNTSC